MEKIFKLARYQIMSLWEASAQDRIHQPRVCRCQDENYDLFIQSDVTEEDWIPHFGEPIANVTVPLGREAILSCTVRNLGLFKVGWLRAEDQTVLSLDKRVVTHNSRISVSQDSDRDTWRLHIRQIKYSDRGCYMCQINTTKMKKQVGCLDVHVGL
uniref:Ig-like domain-containing protein n=1 Tax=Rhodnius prolixus TaxID=13249 RepID=T1I1H8_RHOPR